MKKEDSNKSIYDTSIRMFLLLLIVAWCLVIMYPFLNIILWSLILVLALYPLHTVLSKKLGGRPKLASTVLILSILVIIFIPVWFLIGTLIDEVKVLKVAYDSGTLTIPPPAESIKAWPVVGERLYDFWMSAYGNMEQLILKYKDQLIAGGSTMATGILSAAGGIVQIMMSLFIAGFLLTLDGIKENFSKFFRKVGGEKGDEFAELTLKIVGSVVKGVLGESLVMALLNGIVFLLAGIPFAGILSMMAFVFAVLQIPVFFVTVPVIVYLFIVKSTVVAILWTVVILLVSFSDNILTPLMLGKGAPVPMVVIFIGVIGGFVFSGFIGLFTGAIVMSLGYKLFVEWLNSGEEVNQL